MATPKIDFPTEKDIEAGIKQCERKLQDEYNVNPLIYVMLEALINKKARASQAEEDYAKEGIKIEESYAYKKGATDERQRCIAELKELKDKLLKEWQAMGGWGGNTIDTAKAGAEFQVIDRAIAKLKEAPAKVNDKT